MFIQTEATQDPATLKFLPGRQVLAEGTLDIPDKTQAAKSPLAERLLAISHVSRIVCGSDFISVTKDDGEWPLLKPMILGAIMEHFLSGDPVLRQCADAGDPSSKFRHPTESDADLTDRITSALRKVIDPELGYNIVDLGLVYDVAVAGGIAHVTMTTTTPGCPATSYLRQGASDRASNVPGVAAVDVELTYQPRWGPEMMSREAKTHFRIRDR